MSKGAAGYYGAAELVCLALGLVFACPRTAKENAALMEAMARVSPPRKQRRRHVRRRNGQGARVVVVMRVAARRPCPSSLSPYQNSSNVLSHGTVVSAFSRSSTTDLVGFNHDVCLRAVSFERVRNTSG